MLYLDYSRKHGDWSPNIYGGNENLEAPSPSCGGLNELTLGKCPGTLHIAEEYGLARRVRPAYLAASLFHEVEHGLMHDTLKYLSHDPVHRRFHHIC